MVYTISHNRVPNYAQRRQMYDLAERAARRNVQQIFRNPNNPNEIVVFTDAMGELARWDPFSEMATLSSAMDQRVEETWARPWGFIADAESRVGSLPLDLYETGDEVVVTASLPGLQAAEDVDVTIRGDTLRIQGEIKPEEVQAAQFHRRDRRFGRFACEVTLPASVKVDAVEACFDNGVLTLRLPKTEAAKTRHILVQNVSRPQIASPKA